MDTIYNIFDFLNDNSGSFNIIFSCVVAFSTIVYAYLTKRLVDETQRMREAQTEPRIEVFYRSHDEFINIIMIVIKNIGSGAAYDIHIDTTGLDCVDGKKIVDRLREYGAFESGIKCLMPGQEYSNLLMNAIEEYSGVIDKKLIFFTKYSGLTNKTYKSEHFINMKELKGIRKIGTHPLISISNSLEKIQKDINYWTSGFHNLKVDIFDNDDRDRIEKETQEYIEQQKAAREQ